MWHGSLGPTPSGAKVGAGKVRVDFGRGMLNRVPQVHEGEGALVTGQNAAPTLHAELEDKLALSDAVPYRTSRARDRPQNREYQSGSQLLYRLEAVAKNCDEFVPLIEFEHLIPDSI